MCELLGMNARLPANITLSLNEFARHGGETGPHADGWGIAFYEGPDANLIRESSAAARSNLMTTLRQHKVESPIVLAHIRQASLGPVELKNTHPFRRELMGRVHTFAHNGHLPGVHQTLEIKLHNNLMPVGTTDSEYVFCALMQKMEPLWETEQTPGLAEKIAIVEAFAEEISSFGPANFLYSDSDVLFVFGHKRKQPDGVTRAPGLHYISIECNYGFGQSQLASVEFSSEQIQQVTLVSTLPLRKGGWRPMDEGQLMVVKKGKIIYAQNTLPKLHDLSVKNTFDEPNRRMCHPTQINRPQHKRAVIC